MTDIFDIYNELPMAEKLFLAKRRDLANRLKELIEKDSLSKSRIADLMGKNPSHLSRLLSSEHNPTLKTVCELECILNSPLLEVTGTAIDKVSSHMFENGEIAIDHYFDTQIPNRPSLSYPPDYRSLSDDIVVISSYEKEYEQAA